MTEHDDRLEDLQVSGAAVGELAKQSELFALAAEAFRAEDAERFQDALGRAGLLDRCHWICRWLCSKHCVFVCIKLAGAIEPPHEFDVAEWREFGEFTGRLAREPETLAALLEIVAREDAEAYQRYIAEHKIERFAHQLCHWLCGVRCRLACKRMCPRMPEHIKVAEIPIGRIDAAGYGNGPSSPASFTPPPNPAGGVGDHPFGGSVHINGLFNVAGATEYKVEVANGPAGPWTTAVTTPVEDSHDFGFTTYTRTATGDWYRISDMDTLSEGHTYLTDWHTPADRDALYYVRMVVRNAALTEFPSAPVAVRVDNGGPVGPVLPDNRPLIEFRQAASRSAAVRRSPGTRARSRSTSRAPTRTSAGSTYPRTAAAADTSTSSPRHTTATAPTRAPRHRGSPRPGTRGPRTSSHAVTWSSSASTTGRSSMTAGMAATPTRTGARSPSPEHRAGGVAGTCAQPAALPTPVKGTHAANRGRGAGRIAAEPVSAAVRRRRGRHPGP